MTRTPRRLGATDLETFPVILGGNVFGWTLDEDASFRVLDAALEAGVNAIDTADLYSAWAEGNQGGESETIIGRWMRARGVRDRLVLITKVGAGMGGNGSHDLSAASVTRRAEASLERLGTDRIDLLFSHFDDGVTPPEETLGAYAELRARGLVRHVGASNMAPERLRASLEAADRLGLPRYAVFQPGYSLVNRKGYEEGVAPICRAEGLGVIPYFPLASGFLTGKYRSPADLGQSVRGGGVKRYLTPEGLTVLDAVEGVARKHGVSPAGVSLAWLLHRPGISAPIASVTRESHLAAFGEAASLRLEADDLRALEAASAPF
jgi:aryl-alcohol dehydrogenase-like predicted oxidoreductase